MSKTVSQSVGWIPEEMMKVKSVGKVQVSPDKHHVVFTVTEAVMTQDKSEYLTHIYMTDTAGSDVFPFNSGDKPCTNPQWSPNGEWIAFTLSWSGKNNLYLISPDGDNAQQLTDVKAGVDSFKWSPDGEWIAFVTPDAPKESEEKAEKGKNDARIVDENFKMNRLWVIPVKKDAREKREARLLTNGDFNISSCFGNYILDKVIMNQTCLVHSSRDASYRSTPVFDHDPLEFNHIRLDFSNLLFRSRLAGLQTDLACSRRLF